jgi:hypothetical protein
MTTLFYYRNDQLAPVRAGTGKTFAQHKRLSVHQGSVLLTGDGVFVHGQRIKQCVLFHGEPATLMCCDIPLESIRLNSRMVDKIPLTYIDQQGNVCEGATGRIIFKA